MGLKQKHTGQITLTSKLTAVESMQDVDIINWTRVTVREIIAVSGKYRNLYLHNV